MSEHEYEHEHIARLSDEVEQLREEVTRLKDEAEQAEPVRTNRRQMLRLAGGAALGAAAGLVATGHAAAVDGVTMGTAASVTDDNVLTTSTVASGTRFLFRNGTATATNTSGLPSVATLAAASGGDTDAILGVAVTGIAGRFRSTSSIGAQITGVTSMELFAEGDPNSHHIRFSALPADPYSRVSENNTLDLCNDGLWLKVNSTPDAWRKLAGLATAGSLHPMATARIYDSRLNMSPMASGQLNTGTSRTISVADKRDPTTGGVTISNIVPIHATAVAYNLTVVNTVGVGGFLSVEPGDAIAAGGSSINWNGNGQTIANASVGKLDSSRQIKVFCGGPATSTNFIIDVVGYYL